jgi:hypothetical protein
MRRTMRVYVLDKAHDINVHQRSKSVWIACGEHLGERIAGRQRQLLSSGQTRLVTEAIECGDPGRFRWFRAIPSH